MTYYKTYINSCALIIYLLFAFYPLLLYAQVDPYSIVTNNDVVKYRIVLIGDAGESLENDPILAALNNEVSGADSTLVIFLGDNIYPDGLPPADDIDRTDYEDHLTRQINSLIDVNAAGLFIPGNHDWNMNDENGWDQIKRQADFISKYNDQDIYFSPLNGCPGPEIFDFGSDIRIVILDTQWWLREQGARPEVEDSVCNYCEERTIIAALDSILNESQNKFVILAAHHPLSTHGPHGGYFGLIDHIFPLTNLNEYLWLPLPVLGSLYPLVRGTGISEQDISSEEYQNMKNKIESVVIKYPQVVMASGHEHALQVLEGPADNIYIVSGAGVWGDVEESLTSGDDTIFSGRYEGFINLDYFHDGKIKLSVVRVLDEEGNSEETFSIMIKN